MNEKENCIVENKRYKLVAPDGGWGYVICVAAIINNIAITMFIGSFGIIYKDLLVQLDMGSTAVSLLNGTNIMCASLAGFLTSALLKVMSKRKIAFLACILFNFGLVSVIFINNKILFYICQAIQNAGMGMIYSTTCTIINEYFAKKRFMAMSLTSTVPAIAGLLAPLLIKWCLETYKFQGTILMMFAVSMQSLVASALMQPISKHMVKEEVNPTMDEMILLINEKNPSDTVLKTPTITMTETDQSFEAKIDLKNINLDQGEKTKTSNKIDSKLIDVPVLKEFLKSNACMGPCFCLFIDFMFVMMLPQALYAMGFDNDLVAKAVSLNALGDLVTRVLFVFLSPWLIKIGNQEVYLMFLVLGFISRLGMLWSQNDTLVLIFITLIGVSRCSVNVLPAIIYADLFSAEKFVSALGVFMLMVGFMNLLLGPAIGAIRDSTNSYSTAFYIMATCCAVIILLWSIELLYKRSKHKRIIQREAAEKFMKQRNRGKKC